MSAQFEAVDIMKLYAKGNTEKWNSFLTECLSKSDTNRLGATRYGLQVGMANLAKQNLNDEDVNVQYCRWISSIRKTAKQIIWNRYKIDLQKSQAFKGLNSYKEVKDLVNRDLVDWERKFNY